MIKNESTSISSVLDKDNVIGKIMKGLVKVYDSWRKLIKRGIPPLTIYAKGESLIDYKIYGESVQDGTPTPDTPIEIESVGDKTNNLVNIPDTTVSGSTAWTAKNLGDYELLPGTYTFSVYYKQTGTVKSTVQFSVREYGAVSPNYGNAYGYNESGRISKSSFTIPEGSKGIRIYAYSNASAEALETSCDFYGIQIEAGGTVSEYEPYGYRVPIIVTNAEETSTHNIYLNEPLRKLGEYADYIDFEKQKLYRNVEVIDDTGTLTLEESYKGVVDDTGTSIELPNIPTHKGTTIIEVDTSILPSNMEVMYKGKEV